MNLLWAWNYYWYIKLVHVLACGAANPKTVPTDGSETSSETIALEKTSETTLPIMRDMIDFHFYKREDKKSTLYCLGSVLAETDHISK